MRPTRYTTPPQNCDIWSFIIRSSSIVSFIFCVYRSIDNLRLLCTLKQERRFFLRSRRFPPRAIGHSYCTSIFPTCSHYAPLNPLSVTRTTLEPEGYYTKRPCCSEPRDRRVGVQRNSPIRASPASYEAHDSMEHTCAHSHQITIRYGVKPRTIKTPLSRPLQPLPPHHHN